MIKVTIKTLEAAKPRAMEYKVTVDRGLYLRVAPTGVKTWLVRYMSAGRQRQTRLPKPFGPAGSGFMSLHEARSENARIQALARAGVDFQVQEEETRQALQLQRTVQQAANATVSELFSTWLADGVARKDGNAELSRSFTKDVLPRIGGKPVKDVTEGDLRGLLRAVVARGVNRMAVSLSRDLRQMFGWAEKRQPWRKLLAEGNPAELVEIEKLVGPDYDMSNERSRTLSPDEIRELRDILLAMRVEYDGAVDKRAAKRPLQKPTEIALWISLSTTCRVGELLKAEWAHVDFNKAEWFIPKANVKGSRGKTQDQTVYLSDFTLRQFKSLHALSGDTDWCFPARAHAGVDGGTPVAATHVCVKSVSKQIGDRQERFKSRQPLKHRRHDNTLVLADGKNGDWTFHDLRRTAATMMQALGVAPDVIDRCQNHVMAGSKVRRHYLTHEYADEKREAWRLLGARLEVILNSANVAFLKSA